MNDVLPDDGELSSTLDDLIERLSRGKRTADIRNALLEAKRLKSATMKWGIIPPPPDSRRELLERVTHLLLIVPDPAEGDAGPPESNRRGAPSKKARAPEEKTSPARRFPSIHDEKTKPEGRFPSIHDEETVQTPSKASAGERRRGKVRSIHDEDTAPAPDTRALVTLPTEPPPRPADGPPPPAAKTGMADEPTSAEGAVKRSTEGSVRPPVTLASPRTPPKVQRTLSTPMTLAPLQDLDLSDLELFAGPPSQSTSSQASGKSGLGATQLPPIVMPALADGGGDAKPKIEGFSRAVSSTKNPAVRSPASLRGEGPLGLRPPAKQTELLPAVRDALGVKIVRSSEAPFRPHPTMTNVMSRTVHVEGGTAITLLRIPPGASLPAREARAELELAVLAGAVTIGPHELTAGDLCRVDKGATRDAITTTRACTLLVRGADGDA